ncbi:MAG: phosphate ABC transporter substrate-binding/OmpA family protein, partial [Bacteroidota bacterium]
VLAIVAAAFFGIQYFMGSDMGRDLIEQADSGDSGSSSSSSAATSTGGSRSDDVIKIGVVTWGGYAGGQYFNEGFRNNSQSRFKKEYGIDVEFVLNDDVDASLNAWKKGDIDLHWYTIDAFPTIIGGLKDFDPVVLWQADWSRGGDAIVARRGINSVADLKGKKIAVAELTPSHSFLLYLLEAGNLKISDVEIVSQASAVDAAAAFKSNSVDAAVVWSPDDEQCVRAVSGARILESTRNASNIIADFFFAKRDFVRNNQDKLNKLYEGWMKGASEINNNASNKQKAAKILAEGLNIPEGDALASINNVRLVTHGDNLNFFGLNTDYKGITGEDLYRRMTDEYKRLGFAEGSVPSWNRIRDTRAVQSSSLTGAEHDAEGQKVFAKATKEDETKEAIATKPVSINFRTGEFQLDENAKYIIDKEFVEIAKAFANSRIRIEGNTDNVGSESSNIRLSKKRAQSVADYLINEHNMPQNRFIIVGNGPNKPLASNSTAEGKAQNRRTDFQLVAD